MHEHSQSEGLSRRLRLAALVALVVGGFALYRWSQQPVDHVAAAEPQLLLVVQRDGQYGVIDGDGEPVLPIEFAGIQLLTVPASGWTEVAETELSQDTDKIGPIPARTSWIMTRRQLRRLVWQRDWPYASHSEEWVYELYDAQGNLTSIQSTEPLTWPSIIHDGSAWLADADGLTRLYALPPAPQHDIVLAHPSGRTIHHEYGEPLFDDLYTLRDSSGETLFVCTSQVRVFAGDWLKAEQRDVTYESGGRVILDVDGTVASQINVQAYLQLTDGVFCYRGRNDDVGLMRLADLQSLKLGNLRRPTTRTCVIDGGRLNSEVRFAVETGLFGGGYERSPPIRVLAGERHIAVKAGDHIVVYDESLTEQYRYGPTPAIPSQFAEGDTVLVCTQEDDGRYRGRRYRYSNNDWADKRVIHIVLDPHGQELRRIPATATVDIAGYEYTRGVSYRPGIRHPDGVDILPPRFDEIWEQSLYGDTVPPTWAGYRRGLTQIADDHGRVLAVVPGRPSLVIPDGYIAAPGPHILRLDAYTWTLTAPDGSVTTRDESADETFDAHASVADTELVGAFFIFLSEDWLILHLWARDETNYVDTLSFQNLVHPASGTIIPNMRLATHIADGIISVYTPTGHGYLRSDGTWLWPPSQ